MEICAPNSHGSHESGRERGGIRKGGGNTEKGGGVDGGKERWMLLSSFSVLVLCTWLDSTVVES